MDLSMLHYYFVKKTEELIPNEINKNFDIDDSFRYSCSSFLGLGEYFKVMNLFKKDKYNISKMLHDETYFHPFIYDNMLNAKYKNDYRHLYFVYALVATYALDLYIYPYVKAHSKNNKEYYKYLNMIDSYFAYKIDKRELYKTKITKLFDYNQLYTEEIQKFIRRPIEKNLKFFAVKNYFLHSAGIKTVIDNNFTSSIHSSLLAHTIDIFKFPKSKKHLSYFKYHKKLDTTILNINKQEYIIDDIPFYDSIDDIIDKAFSLTKKYVKAINNYIFFGITKEFKALTGLDVIEEEQKEKDKLEKNPK